MKWERQEADSEGFDRSWQTQALKLFRAMVLKVWSLEQQQQH